MIVSIVDGIIVIGLFFIFLFWYLTKDYDYWKKRNIASLQTYPVVGSYWEAVTLQKHVSLMYKDQYGQHSNERVIGAFNGRRRELIIRDPDIIKTVLIKDFNNFVDRGFNTDTERDPLANHLFAAKEDLWRSLRFRLTPTFTSGKMRKMFPLISECAGELENFIQELVGIGKELEMRDISAKFTTDVIGSCAFGIKMQSMKEESTLFRKMGERVFRPTFLDALKFMLSDLSPSLFRALKLKFISHDVEYFFINLFKTIMKNRENEPPRHDFIDLLKELRFQKSSPTDKQIKDVVFTDELLAAQSFVFFAAGFETSSTTISYCLHELSYNPHIQNRLVDEIKQVLLKFDGKITYESIQEMTYLDKVINETLRKHPPLPWLNRTCKAKYDFPNLDLTIDKGVEIIIPVYALHHDARHFPDPDKFDPERFNVENVTKRHPQVYLPFGDGPRNCIGARFGKLQTACGLISLLKLYSIEPSTKSNEKITYNSVGLILTSKYGIPLKLIPRN